MQVIAEMQKSVALPHLLMLNMHWIPVMPKKLR